MDFDFSLEGDSCSLESDLGPPCSRDVHHFIFEITRSFPLSLGFVKSLYHSCVVDNFLVSRLESIVYHVYLSLKPAKLRNLRYLLDEWQT